MSSKLILASRSPIRARMLRAAGLDFEARPAGLDETALLTDLAAAGASNEEKAQRLAEAKALAVGADPALGDALVIGADQVLDLGGQAFEAPPSPAAARARLELLRGRSHTLISGLALTRGRAVIGRSVRRVEIAFRPFSEAELEAYLALAPEGDLTTVGGYALEGLGATLIARIEGDWFAALGLPLLALLEMLREAGHPAGLPAPETGHRRMA